MDNTATPQKKPLPKGIIATFIIIGVVILAIVGFAIAGRAADSAIIDNGIDGIANSTGQSMQLRDGGKRGSKTGHKAQYSFKAGEGTYHVYGEKLFDTSQEARLERTVQIKYLANDPTKAVVVSGE